LAYEAELQRSGVWWETTEELKLHMMAEKAAKADSNAEAKVVKLLLLGAEDSGKSTICKAVRTICGDGYSEAEQDVLRSRERTTSIVTTDFKIKGLDFAMHDVGSLRNERRKWMHAFDDVNAVIFVADLSGFDEASGVLWSNRRAGHTGFRSLTFPPSTGTVRGRVTKPHGGGHRLV
jgi:hypothetical protein